MTTIKVAKATRDRLRRLAAPTVAATLAVNEGPLVVSPMIVAEPRALDIQDI